MSGHSSDSPDLWLRLVADLRTGCANLPSFAEEILVFLRKPQAFSC